MARARLSQRLILWAKLLKRDGITLWFALRHPGTPRLAKVLAFVVVAYALSPIDLIPDFIPLLGYLDDLVILPALIWLVARLVPAPVLAACRERAQAWMAARNLKPRLWWGAVLVLALWLGLGLGLWWWVEAS